MFLHNTLYFSFPVNTCPCLSPAFVPLFSQSSTFLLTRKPFHQTAGFSEEKPFSYRALLLSAPRFEAPTNLTHHHRIPAQMAPNKATGKKEPTKKPSVKKANLGRQANSKRASKNTPKSVPAAPEVSAEDQQLLDMMRPVIEFNARHSNTAVATTVNSNNTPQHSLNLQALDYNTHTKMSAVAVGHPPVVANTTMTMILQAEVPAHATQSTQVVATAPAAAPAPPIEEDIPYGPITAATAALLDPEPDWEAMARELDDLPLTGVSYYGGDGFTYDFAPELTEDPKGEVSRLPPFLQNTAREMDAALDMEMEKAGLTPSAEPKEV